MSIVHSPPLLNLPNKISSTNNAFYVHSDYKYVYNDINEYKEFFDSRKVYEYKHIIFVSNEAKNSFTEVYKELENKCLVFNNFINQEEIIELSKGEPDKVKNNSEEGLEIKEIKAK